MGGTDELVREIRAALAAGLYFLALYRALTLLDICGALESDNGTPRGPKYKAWLRASASGGVIQPSS
jgi:hypothetical protein